MDSFIEETDRRLLHLHVKDDLMALVGTGLNMDDGFLNSSTLAL